MSTTNLNTRRRVARGLAAAAAASIAVVGAATGISAASANDEGPEQGNAPSNCAELMMMDASVTECKEGRGETRGIGPDGTKVESAKPGPPLS